MLENERTLIVVGVLVEPQTWLSARDQACQRSLAHGKRIAAKVRSAQREMLPPWRQWRMRSKLAMPSLRQTH